MRPGLVGGAIGASVVIVVVVATLGAGPQAIVQAGPSGGPSVMDPAPSAPPTARPRATPRATPLAAAPGPAEQQAIFAGTVGLRLPAGSALRESANTATIAAPGLRIVVDRWTIGADYVRSVAPTGTIRGDSLEAIAAVVDVLLERATPDTYVRVPRELDYRPGTAWITRAHPIRTDGTPMALNLVAVHGTAYLLTALPDGTSDPALSLVSYESIVGSFDSLSAEDVVGLGGGVSITLDGSMHVETSTPTMLRIGSDGPGFLGLSSGLVAWRFTRGAPMTFDAPGGGPVTIAGNDLDKLARAMAAANPKYEAKPFRTSIDGLPALRWSIVVATLEVFGPVRATLTIVLAPRDVYVLRGSDDLLSRVRIVG